MRTNAATFQPRKFFIDTSFWIALLLKQDINHSRVRDIYQQITSDRPQIYTTDYVLDETFTRLVYKVNFSAAKKFKETISLAEKNQNLSVIFVDTEIFEASWKMMEKFAEHKLSFTDAVSYVVFRKLKIDRMLSLDDDFKKVGLAVLP